MGGGAAEEGERQTIQVCWIGKIGKTMRRERGEKLVVGGSLKKKKKKHKRTKSKTNHYVQTDTLKTTTQLTQTDTKKNKNRTKKSSIKKTRWGRGESNR